MGEKTKQHYVPEFYLSNFSTTGGINVFDKKSAFIFGAKIGDVAQDRYFYAVPSEGEYTKEHLTAIEDYLGNIDSQSSKVIKSLLSNIEASRLISIDGLPRYILHEDEKVFLAIFMIFQDLRTRESREKFAQMDYQMSRALLDLAMESHGMSDGIGKYDIDIPAEREAHFHIDMLTKTDFLEVLLAHAMSKHWMIGYNIGSRPLITSDHPVTMKGHNPNPMQKGIAAWGAPYTEITVPLSPKVALLLMCDNFFDSTHGGVFSKRMTENKVIPPNDENVRYCNSLQVLRSYQYLYSNTDEFYEVEDIIKKDPEVGNPYRARAEISGRTIPLPQQWSRRPKKHVKTK